METQLVTPRLMPAGRSDAAAPHQEGTAVLLASADTGGRFALIETRRRNGQESPFHVHTREDEWVYVLEGVVTFHVGDERIRCQPGSYMFLPRYREHAYAVESREARLLVLFLPAGLESVYGELDGWKDVERMVTIAAHYGIEITGPQPAGSHLLEHAPAAVASPAPVQPRP